MQPNILLIFPDQHRHDWLGCAGDLPLNTPHLDALAAQGTRFRRCYTPSPVCSPARACLATGRRYTRSGVMGNRHNTPTDLPNYYRILRDAGYQVSGVGKFDLHKPDLDWGIDGKNMLAEYGFTSGCDNEGKGDAISSYDQQSAPKGPYMHHLQQSGGLAAYRDIYFTHGKRHGLDFSAINPLPKEDYCDNWVGEKARSEIQNFSPLKPWHLIVNFVGPHDPYDVTPDMAESTADRIFPLPHANGTDDPQELQKRRRYYAAMIENIDRMIGELIAEVEARGELDNTLIVYSSDHGEMLGDHGHWGKSRPNDPSVRVPLIIKGPNVKANQVRDDLISLHDLAALFITSAGAAIHPEMDAINPAPLLRGETGPLRSHLAIGLNNWRMIIEDNFKYILEENNSERLIDQNSNPLEDENTTDMMRYRDHIDRYRQLISDEIPFEDHASNNL